MYRYKSLCTTAAELRVSRRPHLTYAARFTSVKGHSPALIYLQPLQTPLAFRSYIWSLSQGWTNRLPPRPFLFCFIFQFSEWFLITDSLSLSSTSCYVGLPILESIIAMQIPISGNIFFPLPFFFPHETLFSVELRKHSWI